MCRIRRGGLGLLSVGGDLLRRRGWLLSVGDDLCSGGRLAVARPAPEWRWQSAGEVSAPQCRPLPLGDRRAPLGTARALSAGCAHRRAGKDVAGCADPRSVAPWPPAKRSAHRQARHHPARTARPLVRADAGHHPARPLCARYEGQTPAKHAR